MTMRLKSQVRIIHCYSYTQDCGTHRGLDSWHYTRHLPNSNEMTLLDTLIDLSIVVKALD